MLSQHVPVYDLNLLDKELYKNLMFVKHYPEDVEVSYVQLHDELSGF